MAKRLQTLARSLVEHYDGKVESLWKQGKPDGAEVLTRLTGLPGFGNQRRESSWRCWGSRWG
ncbi:hypothetical protein BCF44_1464 [Kutzneria buriramensis]|uniref:Uncharacterized protein n=1 Tax=Kutzneria buriramensis TaxID=1045776 RepID=A0A3E0G4F0_9PSEU|nr:hypothetical protein BCF44_1464 [Kutzneria buriramensis]